MSTQPAPTPDAPSDNYAWAATVIAGLTTLGSLYLALEGKYPCLLCFYQRTFAVGALAVLLVGLLGGFNGRVPVALLAMPLAFAGLGVAAYHSYLEREGVLLCPEGVFGISTAPVQSSVMFGLLCGVLVVDAYQAGRPGNGYAHVLGAAALGLLVAAVCFNPLTNKQPDREIRAEEWPEAGKYPKTCLPLAKKPSAN